MQNKTCTPHHNHKALLLQRRVARRYYKKMSGIFEAPPYLVKEVSSFVVKKYAGHVLALTEKRLASMKGGKGGSSSNHINYGRAFKEAEKAFMDLHLFVSRSSDHRSDTKRDFMLRPDLKKALRIRVEVLMGRPHFSYVWVKDGREGRSDNKLLPTQHMTEKVHKIHKKELGALHKLQREQGSKGDDDPSTSLVELNLLRNKCLEYTTKAKAYKTSARTSLEIDLTGWKVLVREMKKQENAIQDLMTSLRSSKGDVDAKIESLVDSPGESVSFSVKNYVGKGIGSRPEKGQTYWVEMTSDGTYLLDNEDPNTKVTLFNDQQSLIEILISRYDEALIRTENVLETINWSSHYEILEDADFESLKVIFNFKRHKKRSARWNLQERELEVDTHGDAQSVKVFENNVLEILRFSRHECQHVGQDLLKTFKGLTEVGGLPSRSLRDDSYTPSGSPTEGRSRKRKDHALQDIEFHTRLREEVDRFIVRSRNIPYRYRRMAARVWVGDVTAQDRKEFKDQFNQRLEKRDQVQTTRFFGALKENEPEKWKKAVKEFITAISAKVDLD